MNDWLAWLMALIAGFTWYGLLIIFFGHATNYLMNPGHPATTAFLNWDRLYGAL